MGASTAAALLRSDPGLRIILAGRSRNTYEGAVKKRPELAGTEVCVPTRVIARSIDSSILACPKMAYMSRRHIGTEGSMME